MYVSLLANNIGSYALPPNLTNILGNVEKENVLLKFAIANNIDSFSLYNLNSILPSGAQSTALRAFISGAHDCGISEINGIGTVQTDFDAIKRSQLFDSALTEIEFWNSTDVSGAFASYVSQLRYIRSIGIKNIYTYLGWINRNAGQTEIQVAAQIAPLVDRVYLHCYVKDATTAYSYCASRIGAFQSANSSLQIMPIFSAESPTAKAGAEVFMGDWLRLNSPDAAESLFKRGFANAVGYQYYDYAFMSAALGGK